MRAATTSRHEPQHLGRALRGVPAEVQQLPTARCGAQVALLVEPAADRAPVEAAAVRLQAQPRRRDADVRAGDDASRRVDDRALGHDRRQRRVAHARREQLLERGVGDPTLARDGVEQPQQRSGARRSGTVHALGRRANGAHRRPVAPGAGERPPQQRPLGHHRPRSASVRGIVVQGNPRNDGEVARLERRDVVATAAGSARRNRRSMLASTTRDRSSSKPSKPSRPCRRAAARCDATAWPPPASSSTINRCSHVGGAPAVTSTPGVGSVSQPARNAVATRRWSKDRSAAWRRVNARC
jgi:hypothetical protein